MTDTVSRAVRSRMMSRIRGFDTKPEQTVRRLLHAAGLRFRLHRRSLPGRPDVVLAARRIAIFVHGCFWHRHRGCGYSTLPRSNRAFWRTKLAKNIARDSVNERKLLEAGWRVLVVWECAIRDRKEPLDQLASRILRWIASPRKRGEIPRATGH